MDPLREHPIGPVRALLLMARPSQVALVVLVYATGVLLGVWRGSTSGHGTGAAGLGLLLLLPVTIAVHWANEAADAATDARSVRTRSRGAAAGWRRVASPRPCPCDWRWAWPGRGGGRDDRGRGR